MEIVLGSTNQGNTSDGNLGPFPSFGNISAPYMEMLSILGFTIGFLVWLFSTPMVLNVQTAYQLVSPPLGPYQSLVDSLHYSPVHSSSSSSSLSGESLQVINQVDKKKKNKNIKKKKNRQGGNQETIAIDATDVEKSSNQPRKVKFPC